MNAAENNLVQLLTGKPSLQDVSIQELETMLGQYPYCSLGQLLLAKKLRQTNAAHFTEQLQHCTVYFQEVAWLQGQLYSKGEITAMPTSIIVPAATDAQTVTIEKSTSNGTTDDAALTNSEIESANLITLPAEDVLEDFSLQMDDVKDEPELPPLDEEELTSTDDEPADATAKIAGVLQQQVEEFKTPVEEEKDLPVTTEPYHTVDYFASQGIKVDTQAPDALTKKVHTFTDWLRQMKRINPYPTDLGSDADMENFVQTIADTSNQPKVIHTEAMAEVLVKQGKLDKAVEVYENLSLLNPGKTAYFAAKINQLKKE